MKRPRLDPAEAPARGTSARPDPTGRLARRLGLAVVAASVLVLDGCASDPCGGGCGGGRFLSGVGGAFRRAGDGIRDTTVRIFNHKRGVVTAGCETCGGASEGPAIPSEGGGVVTVPGPDGGLPPAIIDSPDENGPKLLSPLPPTGSTSGSSRSSTVGPASLRGLKEKPASASNGSRSLQSAPTVGSADLSRTSLIPSSGLKPGGEIGAAGDFLDAITPAPLPDEVARKAGRSPVPPDADSIASKPGVSISLAPGLSRLSSPRPNLYGGSLPNGDGLDWLKEKGVKTLLDLRSPTEVEPSFAARVKSLGFKYVSLPVLPLSLDEARVTSFGAAIGRADDQPLYFFDSDGSRAGLVWYAYRLMVDKVDSQVATREAEELGLTDQSTWVAATQFIDRLKAANARPAPAPGGPSASKPASLVFSGRTSDLIDDPTASRPAQAR